MWAAIYVAEGIELANEIERKLQHEGFLVKVKPISQNKGDDNTYEILVPEFEAEEAHQVLLELEY